jgi:hypothetical protein
MSTMEQGPGGYPGSHQYPPHPYGYGPAPAWGMRMRPSYPIETKPFYLTSEFVASVLAIAGIAITAAASDAFGAWRAWILITAVTVGYLISRGIAKSGTRSNANDPREHFEWGRGDGGRSHRQTQRQQEPQAVGDGERSGPLFG